MFELIVMISKQHPPASRNESLLQDARRPPPDLEISLMTEVRR